MRSWRLTKYDPARRDARGAFLGDDWTSISDIGRTFDGRVLTPEAYARVEQAHVDTVLAFHAACGAPPLRVHDLERTGAVAPPWLVEGALLETAALPDAVRACLREQAWCRLRSDDGACHVHVGYDYYLYLVGNADPAPARAIAERHGLFLEPYPSPYLE